MNDERKQLAGKLTISRINSNRENPRPISITLVDERSRTEAVEIRLSFADFAEALTGIGRVPCEFRWPTDGRVGKRLECKTETVTVAGDGPWAERHDRARAALKPFEVDGWEGDVDDATNHHRSAGNGAYRVGFHRWVDDDGGQGKPEGE